MPGSASRDETSLFDGVDTSLARPRAVRRREAAARRSTDGLAAIAAAVQARAEGVRRDNGRAALQPLRRACAPSARCARELRTWRLDEDGAFEIDFRLAQKEREFQQALVLANGVRVEALADDGVVVPGQPVKVTRDRRPTEVTVSGQVRRLRRDVDARDGVRRQRPRPAACSGRRRAARRRCRCERCDSAIA